MRYWEEETIYLENNEGLILLTKDQYMHVTLPTDIFPGSSVWIISVGLVYPGNSSTASGSNDQGWDINLEL